MKENTHHLVSALRSCVANGTFVPDAQWEDEAFTDERLWAHYGTVAMKVQGKTKTTRSPESFKRSKRSAASSSKTEKATARGDEGVDEPGYEDEDELGDGDDDFVCSSFPGFN